MSNENVDYVCAVCSNSYKKRYILRYHIRTHFGLHAFVCQICKSGFARLRNLIYHQRSHHSSNQFCRKCGQSYSNKKSFQNHKCVEKLPYVCEGCGCGFRQIFYLIRHSKKCTDYSNYSPTLREYHYWYRGSYKCHTCDKAFKFLYHLMEHRIKFHSSFFRSSKIVKPSLPNKSNFTIQHFSTASPDGEITHTSKIVETVAGRNSASSGSIADPELQSQAVLQDEGVDPSEPPLKENLSPIKGDSSVPLSIENSSPAEECSLSRAQTVIGTDTLVTKCKNSHSKTRDRFKCNLCGRDYKWMDSLRWHKRTKHNPDNKNPIYVCTYCGRKMAYKTTLRRHIRTMHPEVKEK